MRTIILLLLLPAICLGNIPQSAQWDVRTTGSDSNGGGFDSNTTATHGTDFSQQSAAQVAYVDLVIGGSTSQLTSSGHAFNSTYVGNIINIVSGSGCTTGRYEVLSVSGVTATMDRSVGTGASTCSGNLGGSLLTISTALTAASAVDISIIWLHAGTYTVSSGIVPNSNQNGLWIVGYSSTHGDNGQATVTTATNSVNLFSSQAGGNRPHILENLIMSNTASIRGMGFAGNAGGWLEIINCSMTGFTNAVNSGSNNSLRALIANTAILNSTSDAVIIDGSSGVIVDSYIYNTTGQGLVSGGNNGSWTTVINTVIVSSTSHGIATNLGTSRNFLNVLNSTISNNGGDGVNAKSTSIQNEYNGTSYLQSNVVYGNTGYGFDYPNNDGSIPANTATPAQAWKQINALGSNTAGAYNGLTAQANDVTLTATPFVNSASQNYQLNSTAGGGTACKGAGFPGLFAGGQFTSYLDIGAVQSQASAGGGTSACAFTMLRRP